MDEPKATKIKIDRITDRGKYKTVKAGDEFYNVWDGMVADRLRTGETVTAMVQTKKSEDPNTGVEKTFHNIVGLSDPDFDKAAAELELAMPGVQEANKLPTPPPGLERPAKQPPLKPMPVDMIEVRKTTLMAAALLLAHNVITQKQMQKTTLEFEKYVLNGQIIPSGKPGIDVNDFVE